MMTVTPTANTPMATSPMGTGGTGAVPAAVSSAQTPAATALQPGTTTLDLSTDKKPKEAPIPLSALPDSPSLLGRFLSLLGFHRSDKSTDPASAPPAMAGDVVAPDTPFQHFVHKVCPFLDDALVPAVREMTR